VIQDEVYKRRMADAVTDYLLFKDGPVHKKKLGDSSDSESSDESEGPTEVEYEEEG